jgi:hypothetical protein
MSILKALRVGLISVFGATCVVCGKSHFGEGKLVACVQCGQCFCRDNMALREVSKVSLGRWQLHQAVVGEVCGLLVCSYDFATGSRQDYYLCARCANL